MSGEHGEPVTVSGAYVLDRHHHIRASCTTEEDAERIKACLNALDGVTTADIEAGAVAKLVEHCRALLNAYDSNDYGMAGLRDLLKPFAEIGDVIP